jgi:hypothetical protein
LKISGLTMRLAAFEYLVDHAPLGSEQVVREWRAPVDYSSATPVVCGLA